MVWWVSPGGHSSTQSPTPPPGSGRILDSVSPAITLLPRTAERFNDPAKFMTGVITRVMKGAAFVEPGGCGWGYVGVWDGVKFLPKSPPGQGRVPAAMATPLRSLAR